MNCFMSTLRRLSKAGCCFVAALAWAGDDERAQDLFQQHRWFELREVPVVDQYAAPLIKGALASAFNRPLEAERQLKLALHMAKGSEQLNAARDKLVVLYLRQGRTRDATSELRAALKRDPSRADLRSLLDLFGPLSSYQSFSARLPKAGADLPCEVKDDGVWLSGSVNGKKVTWLLDTGFNFSGASEAEARSLGIVIHDGGASTRDLAGGEARTKSGVAERITIGGIEFRNVPLLIFPDSQQPWKEWPMGRRGIVGLPQAIAMQTLSWTRDGTCRASFASTDRGVANLAFDDFNPVVRGTMNGRPLEFIMDTGNQAGTQLWSRFKADFPDVVSTEGVTSGTTRVTQIGGANDRPATQIPELRFEAGGMAAVLKPAHLFAKPVGNDYQHGLLGMDVFSQAREIVIDFRTMIFTAR